MNLLPRASGNRPRLACEIFTGGVVAGRSPEPGLPLAAVAKVNLAENAVVPSLKPGNLADRVAVLAATRRALEQVAGRSGSRNAELTLIIPDAAVRVLLLDFDTLPTKLSEALPIVRFRLKKLVPFEADDAMVSFQVMSTTRSMVRVLAVAIPRDVLAEYESLAREAGYEPGAVLPSTLAALAALEEGEGASLVVNANQLGVTTAIVRAGIVLLHRAMELAEFAPATPAGLPATLFEPSGSGQANGDLLPLVDREASHAEWAAQEPTPEYDRSPYADLPAAEISAGSRDQPQDAITAAAPFQDAATYTTLGSHTFDMYAGEAAPVGRSPFASPTLQDQLSAEYGSTASIPMAASDALYGADRDQYFPPSAPGPTEFTEPRPPIHELAANTQAEEISRAVSVAVAYFEDSLAVVPEILLSAGPLGADSLNGMLRDQGVTMQDGLRVRELIDASVLAPSATTASVPRGWLAGVTGALKS